MFHVAIIMDGNGRWALARGLPRTEGHRAGARAVRNVVAAAPAFGITTLTLFALSSDNWRRSPQEIEAILDVVREFLDADAQACALSGIRLSVIGRRDRLPTTLLQAIERAETATATGARLHLRLAVDYSSRDAIVSAARAFHVQHAVRDAENNPSGGARDGFGRLVASARGAEDVDLLVRTGGERRLSDFLLWESAYAELVFSRRMWPEFDSVALRRAVDSFRARERRFGGIARSDAG
ncbi:MAG TPA: polyprenyl diphosphate synthase [Planctomycetota bacterium]|nr:polyprenyl diphosphate synthase [Planctomycetota bacterium]